MGLPTNIKTLLSGNVVEWARIEFKETWDAEASLKTICAFANDFDNWGGGYLIIGIEDKDGKPAKLIGVPPEKIDSYLKDILNKCNQIRPQYMPIAEVVDYKDKKFIVVWAFGGSVRPYSSPKTMAKGEKDRIYWIRKMSSTIAPSEEQKRDLYNLAQNIPFDDRVNHEAEITDLNITLIQSYLKEVDSPLYEESKTMDFVDLCRSMDLISTLPEYTKPKNVGLMFFSFEPHRFFPYAQIDVVQFPDGLGGDTISEKIFKGPIHQQLREALLHISNTVIQERVIKLPNVAESRRFYNYPYGAIKEALANAVYHKGYDVREPVEVRVLPDRIEIVSHPGADRSITATGLKEYRAYSRRYRNRRMGDYLKELHLTEGRNTGFGKILRALSGNGSPKPLFETDDERTFFATTLYIHPEFESTATDAVEDSNEFYPPNRQSGGLDGGLENKILWVIESNPTITVEAIAEEVAAPKRTVERIMKQLKENHVIERVGGKRYGEWKINK